MSKLTSSLIAFLLASAVAAPAAYAQDKSVWDEAFPEKDEQTLSNQTMVGVNELMLGAGTNILFGGDTSMKILTEERKFAEYETQARREVLAEKPGLKDLAKNDRRFKELELFRTKGAGLDEKQKIEHAALKKDLTERAGEYAKFHREVETRRQALMAAEKIMVKPGVWMSPELAHRREMRNLYIKRFGIAGAAIAIAADGALRIGATLSGRDAGYVPAAAVISTIGSRVKAAPKAEPVVRAGAQTSMSVE
jgi:hypothetical protein